VIPVRQVAQVLLNIAVGAGGSPSAAEITSSTLISGACSWDPPVCLAVPDSPPLAGDAGGWDWDLPVFAAVLGFGGCLRPSSRTSSRIPSFLLRADLAGLALRERLQRLDLLAEPLVLGAVPLRLAGLVVEACVPVGAQPGRVGSRLSTCDTGGIISERPVASPAPRPVILNSQARPWLRWPASRAWTRGGSRR
jgi:hypothetical protein